MGLWCLVGQPDLFYRQLLGAGAQLDVLVSEGHVREDKHVDRHQSRKQEKFLPLQEKDSLLISGSYVIEDVKVVTQI